MRDYYLTIIDDTADQVALAAGPAGGGLQTSIILGAIFVVLLAIMMIVLGYLMECSRYRRKLRNLHAMLPDADGMPKLGWNLGILKDQVREEEASCAEMLIESE